MSKEPLNTSFHQLKIAAQLADHLKLPAVQPVHTPQGYESRSLKPPVGLYILAGIMSAIVFWYSFTTAFIMSATGSLSLLAAEFTTLTRAEDGVRTGVGYLMIALGGIALGGCVAQADFANRMRKATQDRSLTTPAAYLRQIMVRDWLIPLIAVFICFTCGAGYHLSGGPFHTMEEILSPPEALPHSPWLIGMMICSAMTVGYVWMAIPGTTALSNTLKETLLWVLGARRTDHHALYGLLAFGGTFAIYVVSSSSGDGEVSERGALAVMFFLFSMSLMAWASAYVSREGRRKVTRAMLFHWLRVQAGICMTEAEYENVSSDTLPGIVLQNSIAEARLRRGIAAALFALLVTGAAFLASWP